MYIYINNNKKLIALRFPQICLAPKNLKRLVKLRKTFCGSIAKNCSKAHNDWIHIRKMIIEFT